VECYYSVRNSIEFFLCELPYNEKTEQITGCNKITANSREEIHRRTQKNLFSRCKLSFQLFDIRMPHYFMADKIERCCEKEKEKKERLGKRDEKS
jgi:hypothetical protein